MNADKVETAVWEADASLLTGPASLRRDLQAMIEGQRQTLGDPAEAKVRAAKLVVAERKRERYGDVRRGSMTLDELKAKVEDLEETRETAKRELASLADKREELAAMKRDRDVILESYASLAPGALDALYPEERRKVYVILNLTVEPLDDGGLQIGGLSERSWFGRTSERQDVPPIAQTLHGSDSP